MESDFWNNEDIASRDIGAVEREREDIRYYTEAWIQEIKQEVEGNLEEGEDGEKKMFRGSWQAWDD
eukprot:5159133-Karenia_brevis.AAC.1